MGNQHGAHSSSNPHSRSHSPASKTSNRGVGHLIFHSGHPKINGGSIHTGIDSGISSQNPSESGSTHDNWDQNCHKSLPPIADVSQEEVDKVSGNVIRMRSRRNSEGGKGDEQSSSKRRSVIESEVLQQLKNRKLDLSHMLPESFRRGRRKSSDNNVPIEIKTDTPKVPAEECFNGEEEAQPRARASTISNGQLRRPFRRPALDSGMNEIKRVSTVFRFTPLHKTPENVHIAGTMTNWTCVKMVQPVGERYYVAIIPCLPRKHFFRFLVDGQWVHDHKEECIPKDPGLKRYWNTMTVDKTDNEVFEALAVDSFALKDQRSSHPNDEDREIHSPWAQEHPDQTFYRTSAKNGPPILPPHLLDVPLNKEQEEHFDPVLLPAPNHVSLQHLYAQSVRDNMLVLSATNRYKRKCITLLFYKPLMPESPPKKKPTPSPAT